MAVGVGVRGRVGVQTTSLAVYGSTLMQMQIKLMTMMMVLKPGPNVHSENVLLKVAARSASRGVLAMTDVFQN